MATYEQLIDAARRADSANDAQAAKRFLELAAAERGGNASSERMGTQERIAAAKAGTLAMEPGSAERAAAADEAALDAMRPQTNLLEQIGSGTSEGLAALAGTPVDLMTMGLNAGARGLGLPEIQNAFGGSGNFEAALDPFISDADPQNAAQRYGRRIGKEVAYGAPIAMATGGGSLPVMAANAAADTAAAFAGQTAREVAPESNTLDAIVSILAGGGTAATMSRPKKPPAPYSSTDEMFAESRRIRGNPTDTIDNIPASGLHASQDTLTAGGQKALFDRLYARAVAANASPDSHKEVFNLLENAQNRAVGRAVDIDELRQIIGNDLAGSAEPRIRRIGGQLKGELDRFMRESAGDPALATPKFATDVAALERARGIEHQGHKAADIERGTRLASNRAARTGRGGNEINTMRQNVGKVYDNEVTTAKNKHSSGYTPDEIAQMEKVNFGTPALNAGRHVAGLAPTTGALQLAANTTGNLGGVGATLFTGNPAYAAAAATPAIVGMLAKGATERGTRAQIDELLDIIRRGGKAAGKELSSEAAQKRIAALLSATDSLQ